MTYDKMVGAEVLHRLAEVLPDAVAEAVDCPAEPWLGPPEPGDIEIRFRQKSELDVGGLDVVIEVKTKFFGHRVPDGQRRADLIRDRLSGLPLGLAGAWLILAQACGAKAESALRGATNTLSCRATRPMKLLQGGRHGFRLPGR